MRERLLAAAAIERVIGGAHRGARVVDAALPVLEKRASEIGAAMLVRRHRVYAACVRAQSLLDVGALLFRQAAHALE
jgi:hypothetical protein